MIFWTAWGLASAAGNVAPEPLSRFEISFFTSDFAMLRLGLLFSIPQWLVLKCYINRAWWWILATALGVTFGYSVGLSIGLPSLIAIVFIASYYTIQVHNNLFNVLFWIVPAIPGGAAMGIVQMLIAGKWSSLPLTWRSVLSWTGASALGITLHYWSPHLVVEWMGGAKRPDWSGLFEALVAGLLYGIATGYPLFKLIQQSEPIEATTTHG